MRISGITYVERKTNRPRYMVLAIILLLLSAFFTLVLISSWNGWQVLHPKKKDIEAFSSNIVPEYSETSFTGTDKSIKLSGWYFKAKSSDRTVIMVHSNGGSRMQFGRQTINLVKELLAGGYNVLTFDLRNSGKSGGKISTFGCMEKEDVSAAIKWSRSQGASHIILMGFSTGASAAMLAALENKSVEAVIADSPYPDLNTYLQNNLDKWTKLPSFPFNFTVRFFMELFSGMDIKNADPLKSVRDLQQYRLLLIHGKYDSVTSVANSRQIADTAGSSAELWETDSAGDATSYLETPEVYSERVMKFLGSIYNK